MSSLMNRRLRVLWLSSLALTVSVVAAWYLPVVLVQASDTPAPTAVTIAGSLQSELGCSGDWQPDCTATHLAFNAEDDVWQGTFNVPAGSYEYKAPLNNSWTENYGANAARDGSNIALNLDSASTVKFYYDHETHWLADNRNEVIAVAPGNFQKQLGCANDWDPSCLRSWLEDPDGDGTYSFAAPLAAGNYEVKVAINESWDENYGVGGAQNGANIAFTVANDCAVTVFTYNASSHVLTVGAGSAGPQPSSVTVAGSLQSELGCPDDWQPGCASTHLAFDSEDGAWQATFNVPAGSYEYKAPLNDSWDENYGANATRGGANIALNLANATAVKFYYDHQSHWITDNKNKVIAVVPGSFQKFLGCANDWDPSCLRSWLKDPDGDGTYSFSTRSIPAGNYEAKVAINESWDENYGQNGAPNGANIAFTVPQSCAETFFQYNAATHVLVVSAEGAPKGNLTKAQAHWVSEDTIAWNVGQVAADWNVRLHYDAGGALVLTPQGVEGGVSIPLEHDATGLSNDIKARFPHIANYQAFKIPSGRLSEVPEALKSQLAVSATDGGGSPVDATSLQIPGVLDDLYTYAGKLGASFNNNVPTLRLWSPTARSVKLHLYDNSGPTTTASVHPLTLDPATGVWSIAGASNWRDKYYLYEVEVFVPSTGNVEHNMITDPYSLSLSRNSQRTQLVDLNHASLKPAGWDGLVKPTVAAPEDIVLYELHIRDFSANDTSVPQTERGTYKAFTATASNGMQHLSALAQSGLTHIHLLPTFDIASVDEDKSQWQTPQGDLGSYPPNSEQQQAAVAAVANQDGYNWGYDPWHYTVPEGSYATDPDGATRIREFRQMVQSLGTRGLHVVMDVVYNHTNAAGQNNRSVLDRAVPGYYHRLDANGQIETSSCCQNTATENNMMEKLMIDSVVVWAKQYKVDGFRFDLMGHHMKRNMLKLRQTLDALTVAADGVDGRQIYLYGEGWNFGEVANNARGVNAIQPNMAGTGIGTFSDRLRDGVRGGGPFSGLQEQGFLTGLYYDPNATNQGSPADQKNRLLQQMDWVRVGLAGNLASYEFTDRNGNQVTGAQVDYNGQPAGYTADPQEIINYIEAHDNETLFDVIQFKAPLSTSMADRVRMQALGYSIVLLGEGVPFIHAGAEILRSKSLDRNSYNSGDWFNKMDFTYTSNNWGVGLPPAGDNQANWPLMSPLLANPALKPAQPNILDAFSRVRELLAVRRSTRLFRLRTAADINARVRFYNTGPAQTPGLIVMGISDNDGAVDRRYRQVVVLINADKQGHNFQSANFAGQPFKLHPIQAASTDALVRTSGFNKSAGSFYVPQRTASVFLSQRPLTEQIALLIQDVDKLVAAGDIKQGQGNALKVVLGVAQEQAARGKNKSASTLLKAFIVEIRLFVRAGLLSTAQGQQLIDEAASIINQLG